MKSKEKKTDSKKEDKPDETIAKIEKLHAQVEILCDKIDQTLLIKKILV